MYFQNQKGNRSGSMFQSINLNIPSSSGMLLTYIYPADSSLSIYHTSWIVHELQSSSIQWCRNWWLQKKKQNILESYFKSQVSPSLQQFTEWKTNNHTPTKKKQRIHKIYSPPDFTSYLSIYVYLFPHIKLPTVPRMLFQDLRALWDLELAHQGSFHDTTSGWISQLMGEGNLKV